jgi:hypothetical protein
MRNLFHVGLATVVLFAGMAMAAAAVPETPLQLWAGYDPDAGDFKEEIVAEATKDGI